MAATLQYFMLPEDERALFRILARHALTVYPELVPPAYAPPAAGEEVLPSLEASAYYLAAERLGPVVVHAVKRGPDKGLLVIEAVPSPVLHYERSLKNEQGELVGGRLWAELDVTDDPHARGHGKHRGLRSTFEEIHTWLRKTFRRSDPKGYWVGPAAARAWKSDGLVLREPGHKGRTFGVWR
jgi:hypothetical protein